MLLRRLPITGGGPPKETPEGDALDEASCDAEAEGRGGGVPRGGGAPGGGAKEPRRAERSESSLRGDLSPEGPGGAG